MIIFAVLGVLFICCGVPLGAISYFGYKGFKGSMGMISCYTNSAMMAKALKDYEAANGGKLPPAATWQTDLAKYFKVDKDMKEAPFQFWTARGEWSCTSGDMKTGFMFNEEFGGKVAAEVAKAHPEVPVIFETTTVAFNQAGKYKVIPFDQSPKLMEEMGLKERRGWILISPAGGMGAIGKKGKYKDIDFNGGGGFNFKVDTDSESNSTANSNE